MLIFGDQGEARGVRCAPPSHEEICSRPPGSLPLFHPTWFGRADWFHRHGYRTNARRCEDQELLFRARSTSRFANLPEPLLGYREDSLPLRNVLMGRASFAGTVARSAIRGAPRRRRAHGYRLAGCQRPPDLLAVSTRLESRLLQHRARPAPAEAVADWATDWEDADRGSPHLATSWPWGAARVRAVANPERTPEEVIRRGLDEHGRGGGRRREGGLGEGIANVEREPCA